MPGTEPAGDPISRIRIGSYRLTRSLGTGGMSSVFHAVHSESGNEVALKILPRSLAKNSAVLQRFLREAKNAEALEHPNIVAIYDRGVDQGRYYLVLEFIDGGDFHDRIRSTGPLSPAETISVARAVAEALKYAAGRGVIHRDVKPANILGSKAGLVKVADLGLALQAEADDERVTRDGTTVGTVDYMAPEQARDSRAASIQSDMYSLGCTLYYLLTGTPPYPGGDVAERLSRHFTQPAQDPRRARPEVPDVLAVIVLRLMAKKPDDRYADYDALIAALDAAAGRAAPVPSATESLDALIDDDDDDDPGEFGLVSLDGGAPSSARPAARPPSSRTTAPRPAAKDQFEWTAPASLADLAALDADDPPPRRQVAGRAAGPVPETVDAVIDDDEDQGRTIKNSRTGRATIRRPRRPAPRSPPASSSGSAWRSPWPRSSWSPG